MPSFQLGGADDADTLARLERAATTDALAHIFGTQRPYPIDDVRARWTIVLDDTDVTTVLAVDGEEVTGYAAFDSVELRHFGVHADRFGTGLADDLHAEVVDRMTSAGAATIRLWVLAENHRARRFYERNGWEPDGRTDHSEFPPHPTQVGYSYTPPPCP